jgi:uncharacterized damage-inducible protein DinB
MNATTHAIVDCVAEKVMETVERAEHLISLVPATRLEWRPEIRAGQARPRDFGHLLAHILDSLSGFCAAFHKAFPLELADFAELRSMIVSESSSPDQARAKMVRYRAEIARGFHCCTDLDLSRKIPTVFAPEGQTLLAILLGNLEHLINHKYQLFFYLKLAGVPAESRDLYKWREAAGCDGQAKVEPE